MKLKASALSSLLLCAALGFSQQAAATVVLVKTNMGNFEIDLFDQTTPITVQNFLAYSTAGSFNNTLYHRSVAGFVLQGGGFRFSGNNSAPLVAVPQLAAIKNEPKLSNVRGTVAMAKVSGDVNSATNQWFINLADNSANLDLQNGGFTVFGQINNQGMEIINAIAALPTTFNANFSGVPLRNYTSADGQAGKTVTADNLILIESVTVINTDVNSSANLNPKANTLITQNNTGGGSSSSGGSFGWFSLLAIAALLRRRG